MSKKPLRRINRNGKKDAGAVTATAANCIWGLPSPTVDSVVAGILALSAQERIDLQVKLETINPPGWGLVPTMTDRLKYDLQKARAENGKRKTSLTDREWEILIGKELLTWPKMLEKHGGNLSALRQTHKRATQFFREHFTIPLIEKDDEGKLGYRDFFPDAPAGKERAEMYAQCQRLTASRHARAAKPVTPAQSDCACTT
jgi:hypothetical protein